MPNKLPQYLWFKSYSNGKFWCQLLTHFGHQPRKKEEERQMKTEASNDCQRNTRTERNMSQRSCIYEFHLANPFRATEARKQVLVNTALDNIYKYHALTHHIVNKIYC